MRPQLTFGNVSATCLTLPHSVLAGLPSACSHLCVVAGNGSPSAMWRQINCQRSVVRVARSRLLQLKSRQVMPGRFAAVSRNGAEELEHLGLKGILSEGENLVSSVGTPASSLVSFQDWYMADKHLVVISFSAFVTAGFMAILLAAAIPSLFAIKKAAESLEKLADTAREELPGTMAAIRLSGMEISDLTMELNDLGQEISKGVRSSARALNAAESGVRQVGDLASNVWQERAVVPVQGMQPLVSRTARQVLETLAQTRALVWNLQVPSRFSSWIVSLQGRTPILTIPFQEKGHKS